MIVAVMLVLLKDLVAEVSTSVGNLSFRGRSRLYRATLQAVGDRSARYERATPTVGKEYQSQPATDLAP